MALDFDLIERSKLHASLKLATALGTDCPDLYLLDDFLYRPLLDKLVDYVTNNDLEWAVEEYQKSKNRQKIHWMSDTVIEETHIVLDSLTDLLNATFNRTDQFLGLTIWKDSAGYTIAPHCDRKIIDMAMQIYLSESDVDLATKFEYRGKLLGPKYRKNSGYLQDNSIGVNHFLHTPVPEAHIRYSLYAVWSSGQHLSDT